MRYVPYDPGKINIPPGWQAKAQAARAAVDAVAPEQRAAEINKHSDVWKDLKPELAKIMNNKCWYTEAPQIGTDTDVDHFRPKNAVKGVRKTSTGEEHPGYWWLAFEPTNYRYSCIVANRRRRDVETGNVGGKADEFPISNETQRAWCPTDDCKEEQSLLIDPCNREEVELITFAEDGEAKERHSKSEKPGPHEKAKRSIELYHLNHTDFVKARISIRVKLKRLIEDAQCYYQELDNNSANTQRAYSSAIQDLREACSEQASFSSFAIAMLQPYRLDDSLTGVFQ